MVMDQNTMVSSPNGPSGQVGVATTSAAPGATGPGANVAVSKSALLAAAAAIAGGVSLAYLFRKGEKLAPIHYDAVGALFIFLSYQSLNIPLTAVAYRFHGHSLSQAWLLFH